MLIKAASTSAKLPFALRDWCRYGPGGGQDKKSACGAMHGELDMTGWLQVLELVLEVG